MTNCIGLWFALSFLLWTLSSTFVCALEFGLHICVCFGPCCSNNFLHICSSCLFQPKNRHENGAYVFFGHVQSCTHPHLYIYICICICTYRLLPKHIQTSGDPPINFSQEVRAENLPILARGLGKGDWHEEVVLLHAICRQGRRRWKWR